MVFKLPANEPKIPDTTPRNYFIWGHTMHGKSFMASEFPNPLILSTDGNAAKTTTPSIELRNIRGKDGKLKQNVDDQVNDIITALSSDNHTFETLIIDVVDDFLNMLDEAVADSIGVEYLGDLAHGKGWGLRNVRRNNILTQLQNLPLNVIYISRYDTQGEGSNLVERPSLKDDLINKINGVSDYNIQCKRYGANYKRIAVDKRQQYQREHIKDERILAILDTVQNAFAKEGRVKKTLPESGVDDGSKGVDFKEKNSRRKAKQSETAADTKEVAQEINDAKPPIDDEPRIAEETMYFEFEGTGEFMVVGKGQILQPEMITGEGFIPSTKRKYDRWMLKRTRPSARKEAIEDAVNLISGSDVPAEYDENCDPVYTEEELQIAYEERSLTEAEIAAYVAENPPPPPLEDPNEEYIEPPKPSRRRAAPNTTATPERTARSERAPRQRRAPSA